MKKTPRILNFENYQKEAIKTLASLDNYEKDEFHMISGIKSELGELYDIAKKNIAYGKKVDVNHVKEEIGDLMWYVACFDYILSKKLNREPLKEVEIKNVGRKLNLFEFCDLIDSEIVFFIDAVPFDDIENSRIKFEVIVFSIATIVGNLKIDGKSFTLEECLEVNIKKLKKRYTKSKFNKDEAIKRNLNKENEVLKKTNKED